MGQVETDNNKALKYRGTCEVLLLIVIFASMCMYMFYVSMKHDTIEKDHTSCLKPSHTSFFTFGWNQTHEQLKKLASMSKGTELLARKLYEHFLRGFEAGNFVFSPSSIYILVAMLALNFDHDSEAYNEFEHGGPLSCNEDYVRLEIKRFLSQNELTNNLFLHYSYDENNDAKIRKYFAINETRELDKFRLHSEGELASSDFQSRAELEVSFGQVKMGFENSGKLFALKRKSVKPIKSNHTESPTKRLSGELLTFLCSNASILIDDYIYSKIIHCNYNNQILDIFLPQNELAFKMLESRFGGFEMSSISADIRKGKSVFRGAANITLPKLAFEYFIDLSRPLQSFGIIKLFNEGLERIGCKENLIAVNMWHAAKFDSTSLAGAFKVADPNYWNTTRKVEEISLDLPFLFSVKNTFSGVVQMFGFINGTNYGEEDQKNQNFPNQ